MVLAGAIIGGAASAGTFEDAQEAFQRNDMKTVIRLLLPLAEHGSAEIQYALSNAYYWRQEYTNAVKWCRRAADQGDIKAQQNLAHMYLLGEGVPRDFVEAYKWFSLAAAHDTDETWQRWAREDLNRLEPHMTPAQIAEAQKLTREWKPNVTQP